MKAVVNAVYTQNHCPTRALDFIKSEKAWSGKRPRIAHMCVFGCVTYAMLPDEYNDKLNANNTKCLSLGNCEGT